TFSGEPASLLATYSGGLPPGLVGGSYSCPCRSSLQSLVPAVLLDLTPVVDQPRSIVLELCQITESLTGVTNIANVGLVPLLKRSETRQVIKVQDGATVVLAGTFETTESLSASNLPLLNNLPGLDTILRKLSKRTVHERLVLLMRITRIPNAERHLG